MGPACIVAIPCCRLEKKILSQGNQNKDTAKTKKYSDLL